MGLCYSLRPRLFGDLSGTISNANSDTDQPPDLIIPSRAVGESRRDESGGNSKAAAPSPLRAGGQTHQWDSGKIPVGERRLAGGDATNTSSTAADGALIQNGGGGGGKAPGTVKDRSRRLHLLPTTSSQKAKNWDKLVVEEKEAEKEARKVSKNIDRVLKELKREYKQTHRLLLLGKIIIVHYSSNDLSLSLSCPDSMYIPSQLAADQLFFLSLLNRYAMFTTYLHFSPPQTNGPELSF